MHFTTLLATSAAISGALAGQYYEEPVYTTVDDKVYTSVKTCTDTPTYAPTDAPMYEPAHTDAPMYEPAHSDYPVSEVTYTSYEKVTVTSCADYVVSCPAETYTSTAYSVSTCDGYPVPTYEAPATTDYYVPHVNATHYDTPVYETPAPEPYPTHTEETYTHTYYTTVCPGEKYCYGTTVTSTYCPEKTDYSTPVYHEPSHVPTKPVYEEPVHEEPSYTKPVYTPPVYTAPPACDGYSCPEGNATVPVPPPSYTGAASANTVSFGVAAVAGLVALFVAA